MKVLLDNTFDTLRHLMPEVMKALQMIKVAEIVHINA